MSNPKEVTIASTVLSDPPDNEVTSSWWRRIIGLVWDTAEGDPRNRKYVQKIDMYML